MSNPVFRWPMTATILLLSFTVAIAEEYESPIIFKSENGQVSFTLRKGLQPLITETELQLFRIDENTGNVGRVYEVRRSANQPIVLPPRFQFDKPEQAMLYSCIIGLKSRGGDWFYSYGNFYRKRKRVSFLFSEERENLPGPAPLQFYQSLTQSSPENAAAWLMYGIALTAKHGFGIGLPPPPPPVSLPLPPDTKKAAPNKKFDYPTKEEMRRYAEERKRLRANSAARQKEFKTAAIPAIRKAYEMTTDCDTKDAAMYYLAWMTYSIHDNNQAYEWFRKRRESECSSKEGKAESYLLFGVLEWNRAFELTKKYMDNNSTDPFHFRQITSPQDRRRFDDCLRKAENYIDKALEADPDHIEALYYKGLVYREKQKTTFSPADRENLIDEAKKINDRINELSKQ